MYHGPGVRRQCGQCVSMATDTGLYGAIVGYCDWQGNGSSITLARLVF